MRRNEALHTKTLGWNARCSGLSTKPSVPACSAALRPPYAEPEWSSSPSADESCPLDVQQLTPLPGKPVLFLSLISCHFSTESQGGSAARTRRASASSGDRCLTASWYPFLPSSWILLPLLDIHPSFFTWQACIFGFQRRVHMCTPIILEQAHSTTWGWLQAHVQRRGRTSHCALTHDTHACYIVTILHNLLNWI